MNLHVIIIKIGESYWPYFKKNNFIFISISSSHFQGFEVIQLTRTFVFWRQSLGNEAVKPANLKLVWIVNHILYNFLIYLQKKRVLRIFAAFFRVNLRTNCGHVAISPSIYCIPEEAYIKICLWLYIITFSTFKSIPYSFGMRNTCWLIDGIVFTPYRQFSPIQLRAKL